MASTKTVSPLDEIWKVVRTAEKILTSADSIADTVKKLDDKHRAEGNQPSAVGPRAAPSPESAKVCPRCQGTCQVRDRNGVVGNCPDCVSVQEKCPTCNGKGVLGAKTHQVGCPACGGVGWK